MPTLYILISTDLCYRLEKSVFEVITVGSDRDLRGGIGAKNDSLDLFDLVSRHACVHFNF